MIQFLLFLISISSLRDGFALGLSKVRNLEKRWLRCATESMENSLEMFTVSLQNSATPFLLDRWVEIVSSGKVQSSAVDPSSGKTVRFGLRLGSAGSDIPVIEEFTIDESTRKTDFDSDIPTSKSRQCGPFPVFLAQNRRLRPPAAPGLSQLPKHSEEQCSMCTGPLRLEAREMVAKIEMSESARKWDCHFNISPMTPQGHFLLVPDMTVLQNRRPQSLLLNDCIDMVDMGRHLPGLCINYNSPCAGASQNHIHVHAWVHGEADERYASEKAPVDYAFGPFGNDHSPVKAIVKDYPASCICLEGGNAVELGTLIYGIVMRANKEGLSHNVACFEHEAYVFLRQKEVEIAQEFVPDLKIGSCQMLGLWAVDTEAQYNSLTLENIRNALAATKITDVILNSILTSVFVL